MPIRLGISRMTMGIGLFALLSWAANVEADSVPAIMNEYATVNGVKLHYLVAGKGTPVILLHGYAQNSHMWRPLMKELAKTHLVVAPDLRGFGDSAKPESGYDKKTMAQDVHALAQSLGIPPSSPRPSSPCRCWCWAGRSQVASFSFPKASSLRPMSKASSSSGLAIGSSTKPPDR